MFVSICPCDEHFSNLSTGSIGAPSSVLCCEVEGANRSTYTVEIWHSEGHDGNQFTSFINLPNIDRMVLSLFFTFLSLFVIRVISICPCDEHFSNLSTGSIGAPFQPSVVRSKEPMFPHVHC
ncbi:uncharacterized protein [Triticum aestivum]|uniref:uncharacterized protein n=1 Tax=Triticum aestivum TaxID=4565 RepID=UPI001D02E442|nr:uncharacterized protein LOC123114738 [Triticum aestivum]